VLVFKYSNVFPFASNAARYSFETPKEFNGWNSKDWRKRK
jgi:hypothetical protein